MKTGAMDLKIFWRLTRAHLHLNLLTTLTKTANNRLKVRFEFFDKVDLSANR
jgi:hypothetical protein